MKGIPKVEDSKLVGWHYPPNVTLLIFFAKTKMKDRGYDENSDTMQDNTLKITHNIVMNNNQDNKTLDFSINDSTT